MTIYEKPKIETLSNGVTLINAPTPSRNVGIILAVRAGSRDETKSTAGLAHFLEHLFFKGTKTRPTTMDISREVDRLGASTNAYTDTEDVAYVASGPASKVSELSDILCDMLSRPLFQAEEVERERNVVLQELSARLLDPEGWAWDRLGMVTYGGDQPMSWSAAGFPEVVETVSRDQIIDYHKTFYSPSSTALIISGGSSLDIDTAEKFLKEMPTATPKSREKAVWGQGEKYIANVRQFSEEEEPQINMLLSIEGLNSSDADRVPLNVMAHILGGGMSSRLFHTVRERNGLCYRIYAQPEQFEDSGRFTISTATRPEDAIKAVKLSFDEFRNLATVEVDDDELNAAKSSMVGSLYRGTETAMASASFFASRWLQQQPLETPDERAAAYEKVTKKEIKQVAQRLIENLKDIRVSFVGPIDIGSDLIEAAIS